MNALIQRSAWPNPVLLAIFSVSLGCGQPAETPKETGPSYADLVTIHSAELAALDRLAKYNARQSPSPEKALQALGDVLNTARQSETPSEPIETLDPNALLDRAADQAQKTQDVADQILDSFAQDAAEVEKRGEELSLQLQRELEEIDKQIEKQRERVRRAAAERDAAEAARK